METLHIKSESELPLLVEKILVYAKQQPGVHASVIALIGELGAGKTTFVQHLARALAVAEVVSSPTYVIMKQYPLEQSERFSHLVHIDAYRIDSDDEMRVLAFPKLLEDPQRLICIEWPERIQALLPAQYLRVEITQGDAGSRTVTITQL